MKGMATPLIPPTLGDIYQARPRVYALLPRTPFTL